MYGAELRQRKSRRLEMPRVLDRYPENIQVDFRNCSAKTLRGLISRYSLDCRDDSSIPEMAAVVARHFERDMSAQEEYIIPSFVDFVLNYNGGNIESKGKTTDKRYKRGTRASNNESSETEADDKKDQADEEVPAPKVYCFCQRESFGEMIACDCFDCPIEWFHVACVGIDDIKSLRGGKWYCNECEKGRQGGSNKAESVQSTTSPFALSTTDTPTPKAKDETEEIASTPKWTYSGMISDALERLPNKQGSFTDICVTVEKLHSSNLNWKTESDARKTPVWKSSIRKILFSNAKFQRIDEHENIYGFA